MPRKVGERWARFANIVTAVFRCPHCRETSPYHEGEIDPEGICCRACRRFFRPATLEKDRLCCAGCRCRLTQRIEEREADRLYRFCPDCAAVFDALVADFDRAFEGFLRGLLRQIRARRYAATPLADTAAD